MNPRHIICTSLMTAALALASVASADSSDPTNHTPQPTPAEAPTKPADEMPAERFALHVAPAIFVPFGTLADVTQMGGGLLTGLDYRISPRLTLTIRGGFVMTNEKELMVAGLTLRSGVDFVPLLGGIKWYLAQPIEGLFFAAEAGPVVAIGASRLTGQAANVQVNANGSGKQTNLGAAASLGYQTGMWDLRAGVLSLDAGHASNSMGVMATAALSFARF